MTKINSSAFSGPSPTAFHLPHPVLLACFAIAAVGGCFDYAIAAIPLPIQNLHRYFCYGFIALLLFKEAGVNWRLRLRVSAIVLAALMILSAAAMIASGNDLDSIEKEGNRHATLSVFFFLSGVWLAIPLFTSALTRQNRLFNASLLAFFAYGAWELASCAASSDPNTSYYFFPMDRAILFPLLAAFLRLAPHDERLARTVTMTVLGTMGIAITLGVLFGAADMLGSEAIRSSLERWNIIHVEGAGAAQSLPSRRLTFPTLHFNRTAFYGLIALALFGAATFATTDRRKHWLAMALIPLSLAVILMSYTRGVAMAAAAGLLAWALLDRRWKTAAALVITSLLIILAMPPQAREHFMSIFQRQTYVLEPGSHFTSMKLRFHAWRWAAAEIKASPVFGTGFSPRVTRSNYEDYLREDAPAELRNAWEHGGEMVHTHNVFIETALQSGLPAMLALLAFFAARWLLLWQALRQSTGATRSRMAIWLALEAALLLGGMVFYMLKRNLGFLFFYVWIWMLLDAWRVVEGRNKPATRM